MENRPAEFTRFLNFKQTKYLMANQQAQTLNKIIQRGNPTVYNSLSRRGKEIFFPKKGILAQAAEAKGKKINATIGIALDDKKVPTHLPSLAKLVNLKPEAAFPYAPSYGLPELRQRWKKMLVAKNPSLKQNAISTPVVTAAITHALSIIGYLFIDKGDTVIIPDLFWGNYKLIFQNTYGAKFATFPLFKRTKSSDEIKSLALDNSVTKLNLAGLKQKLLSKGKKKILLLNFPNNPTGYTPLEKEARAIANVLKQAAQAGKQILVVIDDAYFGLVYEKQVARQSIFSLLHNLHSNLLAVKLDGATKEDYVWGFRVGFITYGIKGGNAPLYEALIDKTAGAIRGTISNAPRLSQSLLLAAYNSPTYKREKKKHYKTLQSRYRKVKQILNSHPEYQQYFHPYPFNSGYFMCVKILKSKTAEPVRRRLLKNFDTGVIAFENNLRIAFSSVPENSLSELFENIHKACRKN